MPKYTFEIDGKKYSITSDVEPTREQVLQLIEQKKQTTPQETPSTKQYAGMRDNQTFTGPPERLTEENIIKDPTWVDASKKIYEWDWQRKNPNKPVPKLSDEGYGKFGLEYGGGLSYSDVDLLREGQAIGNATPEQKEAFIQIMDMYDTKAPSMAGAGRALKNILNPLESPSTYVGFGVGKAASTAGKQLVKDRIKNNLMQSIVKSKPARYAVIGSAEGGAYGGAYETARQRARIRADAQKEYQPGQIAEAVGVGTLFGGVLGSGVGVLDNAIKRRAAKKDPELTKPTSEKEIDLLQETIPETQPLIKSTKDAAEEADLIQPGISQKIEEITEPVGPVNVVVDEDFGIVGKIPYIGTIYKKLGNNILNKIQAKTRAFSTLGDLPDQPLYLGTRGMYMGKLENVGQLAKNVFKSFNKLKPEENKSVYGFLTGEKTLDDVPQNLQDSAIELRRGIDTVSETLENNGLLTKEVMEENFGTYLPRLFLKYFNKNRGSMGYLKQRKDLDKATREFLGEIEDVGLLAAKAIEDPISDVVKLGFFRDIAKNPNWAVQDTLVPFRGKKIGVFHAKSELDRITKEVAEGLRDDPEKAMSIVDDLKKSIDKAGQKIADIDLKKFKQIPDQKKYGELRGAYIRKEIYDDLIGSTQAATDIVDHLSRKGRDLTKIWKTLKVPLNPPSVVRNFISNLVLLNLSGVSYTRMPLRMFQALKEIVTDGKYYKIAKEKGIASTTFSKQEMVQINRMYKIIKAQKTKNWLDQADRLGTGILNFAGDSYGFIETFGKLIKIIDDMEAGKNAETAVYNAQKTLFDYSLVPPRLKQLRQSPFGVPFATFQYKVLPFLTETFIRHPERFVKYMAVPYIAAQAWKKQNEGMTQEDLDTLKETLPTYLRDGGSALVLPYKDDEGRWQFYDYSYTMPWGFYTGIGNKIASGEFAEATDDVVGLWGGPGLNIATAITTNKDPFTNRDIVDTAGTPVDQAADILNYAGRLLAPTWLTDQGFAGKMYEAVTKEPNYYGDPTITKPQAWYRLVGQNVYPVDPEQSRNTNLYFKNRDIEDVKKYYRKRIIEAELRGDADEVQRLEQEALIRINTLADSFAEYEAKSRIPERLKRKPPE